MKILFVTNLYPTASNPDYGIFTKEQIDSVLSRGIKGDVLFINAKENGIKEYFRALITIRKITNNYDLIHCFHGLSLITSFLAKSKQKILVSFLNSIENESLLANKFINSFFIIIYKYVSRKNRVYKIFKDSIPSDETLANRSFYLPNGVDLDYFKERSRNQSCYKLKLDINFNYVLFVASKGIDRVQKRYDIFSETILYLQKNYPEYNFKELILSKKPREVCELYYNAASANLLTSDYEGSPNSVKEAMACNLRIVSTPVGNVSKMISGIENCFISKSNCPNELGELVVKAINSVECNLRDELEKRRLTSKFKTNELIEIYKDILNVK